MQEDTFGEAEACGALFIVVQCTLYNVCAVYGSVHCLVFCNAHCSVLCSEHFSVLDIPAVELPLSLQQVHHLPLSLSSHCRLLGGCPAVQTVPA